MKTQVVIFGGGIAGLWLLNRLRQKNIACLLIENKELGSGQTLYSQGIIHSGLKYALHGKLTVSAEAMKGMPTIWRQCLEGEGEIDLSDVTILSEYQYLWSPGSIASNLAAFLASKNLKGQVSRLARDDYPDVFAAPGFSGTVYRLEEPVLAVRTVLEALSKPYAECLLKADLSQVTYQDDHGYSMVLRTDKVDMLIEANHVVLLAGQGNRELAEKFGLKQAKMQLRPLRMVSVIAPDLPMLYAHAMQVSDKPRITITTHRKGAQTVWYLGGDLAETGVKRTPEEQIAFARQELIALFPTRDFSSAEFKTYFIERAEAFDESLKKPEGPSIVQEGNIIAAWVTKLAFAPLLAQYILDRLSLSAVPLEQLLQGTENTPNIASYPWDMT